MTTTATTTANRKDLAAALRACCRAIDKKSTIPILRNILFRAEGETLTLTGTDLDTGVVIQIPAEVQRPGSITIPAHQLLKYVQAVHSGTVTLEVGEGDWITVTAGEGTSRFPGMPADKFPELPAPPSSAAVKISANLFADMIERTRRAVSTKADCFTLHGALLEVGDGIAKLTATDGHRLAQAQGPVESREQWKVFFPATAMREVRASVQECKGGGDVDVRSNENHLFFQLGVRSIVSRKLEGNFPDYERVIPKEFAKTAIVNREGLCNLLKLVLPFADEIRHPVQLRLTEGQLVVEAHTADHRDFRQATPAEYQGTPIEIGMNGAYLLDYLRLDLGEKIELCLNDRTSSMLMRPVRPDDCSTFYLVMPLRPAPKVESEP